MALYHSYNCPVRTVNMQRILRSLTALPCLVMAGGGGGGVQRWSINGFKMDIIVKKTDSCSCDLNEK